MTLTLEQFKNQTLGGTYGTPPPVMERNQGTFQGQCASYCRQYVEAVLGIKSQIWGNAVDWWTNPKVLALFDRIIGTENRRDGDILVWGDDPGNFTGKEGHDAIAYGGKILNQNYGGSLNVSINDFFPQGYLGALRFKGEAMKTTQSQVYYLRSGIYAETKQVSPDDPDIGRDYAAVAESYLDYANRNGTGYWQVKPRLENEIIDLKKKIAELEAGGEYVETKVYIKKEKK